jgi:hypothetical protein
MRYPSPKTILFELSTCGPSAARSEALRLLALPLPAKFGPYPKRSRESLMRRLICDRKKSATARMAALKELVFGWTPAMEDTIRKIEEEKQ